VGEKGTLGAALGKFSPELPARGLAWLLQQEANVETYRPNESCPARTPTRALDRPEPPVGRPPPARSWRSRWQPPQANGSFWLLTAFTLACGLWLGRPPPRLPTLLPMAAPCCPVPVEVPGQGVICLADAEAQRLGLVAGAVWPSGPSGERVSGPPTRMAPRRLLVAQVLLDPQTASAAELEALPDLGPQLARRIVAARVERAARGDPPLRTRAALLQIAGFGENRLQRLLPYFIPLL